MDASGQPHASGTTSKKLDTASGSDTKHADTKHSDSTHKTATTTDDGEHEKQSLKDKIKDKLHIHKH